MKFIKVNGLYNHIFYLNTSFIRSFGENEDEIYKGRISVIGEEPSFVVKETPEQILELINK